MGHHDDSVTLFGWVRTRRDSKAFSFLEVNDGSCLASIQVIIDSNVHGVAAGALPLRQF